jgi:hypothetical protein
MEMLYGNTVPFFINVKVFLIYKYRKLCVKQARKSNISRMKEGSHGKSSNTKCDSASGEGRGARDSDNASSLRHLVVGVIRNGSEADTVSFYLITRGRCTVVSS